MEPDIMRSEAMATRYGTERGGNWEARGKGRRAVFRSLFFFCSGLWKKSGFTLFCFAGSRSHHLAAARRPLFPPPQFALLLPFFFRFKVYKRENPINREPIVKVGMWQGRIARG
jgi:hypothetical protein